MRVNDLGTRSMVSRLLMACCAVLLVVLTPSAAHAADRKTVSMRSGYYTVNGQARYEFTTSLSVTWDSYNKASDIDLTITDGRCDSTGATAYAQFYTQQGWTQWYTLTSVRTNGCGNTVSRNDLKFGSNLLTANSGLYTARIKLCRTDQPCYLSGYPDNPYSNNPDSPYV